MKSLLLLALLITACASTQPVSQPVGPSPIVVWKTDTILRIVPVAFPSPDTNTARLYASGGDDQPIIQALVNAHKHIRLMGLLPFKIYNPIGVYTLTGKDYGQSWCDIEGQAFAQDANSGFITTILVMYTDRPGIWVQQGKGFVISNIMIVGLRKFGFTQYQVNTMRRQDWSDGSARDSPTSPYFGIVIDPFSDPKYLNNDTTRMYAGMSSWYLPGMSLSGSTAGQMIGLNIQGFTGGILFTAVNQQNDELMQVTNCQIGNCLSAIASTQAQAKKNVVRGGMFWGEMHTICDGTHYGIAHGDGVTLPDFEDCNTAGLVYQFVEANAINFASYFRGNYFENIFKIGSIGVQTSPSTLIHFDDCQFDFENGGPSPNFWYHGAGTVFTDCVFRFYNGGGIQQRIVLNDQGNKLDHCGFGAYPPVLAFNAAETGSTDFVDPVYCYRGTHPTTAPYDSIGHQTSALLRVNRQTFTGSYLTTDTAGLTPGTLILTSQPEFVDSLSVYGVQGTIDNWQIPLGYFDHAALDSASGKLKVFLDNVGVGQTDSSNVLLYKALVKKQF